MLDQINDMIECSVAASMQFGISAMGLTGQLFCFSAGSSFHIECSASNHMTAVKDSFIDS